MTTLAEINQTLQQQLSVMTEQGQSIERTSDSIESVKKTIASVLLQQKSDRLQAIEDKRELTRSSAIPSGFMTGLGQGSGLSGLGSGLSGLTGLLAGALGLVGGKLIKWGAIAGAIALFFGDEILQFFENIEYYTGIDLPALMAENPLITAAVLGAGVALTKMLLRWVLGAVGGYLAGLGAAALAGILGGGADDVVQVDPDERDKDKKKGWAEEEVEG